jgi:hypothetical protein
MLVFRRLNKASFSPSPHPQINRYKVRDRVRENLPCHGWENSRIVLRGIGDRHYFQAAFLGLGADVYHEIHKSVVCKGVWPDELQIVLVAQGKGDLRGQVCVLVEIFESVRDEACQSEITVI